MCGLNVSSLRSYANKLRLSLRSNLKHSANEDITRLWNETSKKNINVDCYLNNDKPLKEVKKELILDEMNSNLKHVKSLTLQGAAVSSVIENIPKAQITKWTAEVNKLPAVLFNFVRKAMIQQLATNSNLARWRKMTDATCQLCKASSQTNKRVLNNCAAPIALERYKTRHDVILRIIANWLKTVIAIQDTLHVDLISPSFKPLNEIFKTLRPDIAIVKDKVIYILELTICHETNLESSQTYKQSKYENIKKDCVDRYKHYTLKLSTVEITSLGHISSIVMFLKSVSKINRLPNDIMSTIIGNSSNIYKHRNDLS